MQTIKVTLTGVSPMMMHNARFANPLDPATKAHKALTGKRKKTDEDHEAIAYSEWCGALYHDKEIGPYVPANWVESMLIESSKGQKLGKKFKSAVMVVEDKVKVEYDGPRDIKGMFKNPAFVDVRSVKVQQARLQRCRPIFDQWKLNLSVAFNPAVVEEREVIKALEDGGQLVGLGDYRPRFGKFEVKVRK
jgi:hypothetical protein